MQIEIIAGSPRKPSLNLRVANYLYQHLKAKDNLQVGLIALNELDIPPIQSVWTDISKVPDCFQSIAKRIFNADAFVLSTPEYNGSYSPALKNLLDHFPAQRRKPFGIVTSSTGMMGGMRAAQQMLQLVPALHGISSPQLLLVPQVDKKFNTEGELIDKAVQPSIDKFIDEFLWLANKLYS